MKLLLIRHGDPDYATDSLTPTGEKEAKLLAQWLAKQRVDELAVSPRGRAQATVQYTAEALGLPMLTLPWLREIRGTLRAWEDTELEAAAMKRADGNTQKGTIPWNLQPSYLAARPDYFDPVRWRETEVCKHSGFLQEYDEVTASFDAFLAERGYARESVLYRATAPNDRVIALFCHAGVESVLLSHLIGASPFVLLHWFISPPTGVTVVHTEERIEGTAIFRIAQFGETSHLALGGAAPSFRGRFCERFTDDAVH